MEKRGEHIHLIQLKHGNIDSFKWLYRQYYHTVYHFSLSLTKSPEDAEEITSDVFVSIWKKRARIDASRSLKPLLLKITKDLTWNFLKRTSRKQALRERFFQNYFGSTAIYGEEEFQFEEYLEIIDDAITKLSPQQQRVFTLRYLRGKELGQISRELAISKNTVKVHLANAKKLVLDYLKVHADICFLLSLMLAL